MGRKPSKTGLIAFKRWVKRNRDLPYLQDGRLFIAYYRFIEDVKRTDNVEIVARRKYGWQQDFRFCIGWPGNRLFTIPSTLWGCLFLNNVEELEAYLDRFPQR